MAEVVVTWTRKYMYIYLFSRLLILKESLFFTIIFSDSAKSKRNRVLKFHYKTSIFSYISQIILSNGILWTCFSFSVMNTIFQKYTRILESLIVNCKLNMILGMNISLWFSSIQFYVFFYNFLYTVSFFRMFRSVFINWWKLSSVFLVT